MIILLIAIQKNSTDEMDDENQDSEREVNNDDTNQGSEQEVYNENVEVDCRYNRPLLAAYKTL